MNRMKNNKKNRKAPAVIAVSALALTLSVPVVAAVVKGDVNGDGKVSIADIVMLCKYLVTDGTVTDESAADYNEDSQINAADLTGLKRAVMNTGQQTSSDGLVTAVTFSDSAVTLTNADGKQISAEQAGNITVTDGTVITITQPCELDIDGECANGQICVNVDKTAYPDGQVTLNLRGLTLTNQKDSPVYVASIADECVITVKKDTVNTLTDGKEYQNADGDAGVIYSCDDLKFKGKGTLIINGQCADGIVSKDDIKIWNGDIQVNALDDGIRGKDSVRIGDPDAKEGYDDLKLTVKTEQGDGIKSTSTTTEKTDGTAVNQGFVRINGGTVDIDSYLDGIQGEQSVEINGGDITIKTYTGSSFTGSSTGGQQQGGWGGFGGGGGFGGMNDGNPNKTDVSAKGIKAVGIFDEAGTTWQSGGDIIVTGGHITVDSSDDALHCGGSMTLTGGIFNIASADDGFHSDHDLTIGTENAGTYDDVQIYISKGYEGIEGVNIYQNSGTVYVVTTDDGYNAAGGADSSGQGGGNPWGGGFMSSTYGELWLRGGLVVVNSANGDHDGFDSNGPINISGGYYFCNGQDPLDSGDGYSITQTGGTYVTMTAGNTSLVTTYTIKDASGNAVATFKWAGGTAGISSKDNSTAYSGTTVSGGTEILSDCPYGVTLGGTVSGGTQITAAASSGGMGGPGGRRRPDEIQPDEISPEDMPSDEMQPDDMPPDGMQPGDMPPDGMKPGNMPPDGMKRGDMPPDGMKRGDMPPNGIQSGGI